MLIAGAALFAKRKQKSEKWIVDENTVKLKAANAAAVAAAAVASEVNNAAAAAAGAPAVMTSQQSRVEQTQKMASVQVKTKLKCRMINQFHFSNVSNGIILTGCFRRTSSQVGEIALGSGPGRRNGEHGLPGALAQSSARSGQPNWNAGEKQGAIRTGGAYDAVGRRSGPAQAEHEASG